MISENFTTKFFTETVVLQGFSEGGIDADLFKTAFFELASRELPISVENNRHKTSFEVVSSLVNTPRRFHRFKYALGRRLPYLLDEVDEYDLLVIAALEACDAAVLRILLNNASDIFIKDLATDQLKKQIEALNDTEKKAYGILIQRESIDALDKFVRAAAKEHWRAAFLGVGTFTSILKWADIYSQKDDRSVLIAVKELLNDTTVEESYNYEKIIDILKDLFQNKYDVEKNAKVICDILNETGRTKLGPLVTPALARIIEKKLAAKNPELRFDLLKVYLSLEDVDYSFLGRLFFNLVEDQEKGKVTSKLSDHHREELSQILLTGFMNKQHTLDLSENCISYIYRAKWASQHLNINDPTIPALISKLKEPDMVNTFTNSLLSLRNPWQPHFSDFHVDIIQRLLDIDRFNQIIKDIDYSKLNSVTIDALNDFKNKFAKADGDLHNLAISLD